MRFSILIVGLFGLVRGSFSADQEPKKEAVPKPQAVTIHAKNERYNGPGEVAPATNPSDTGSLVIRHVKQLYYYKAAPPEQRVLGVAKALGVPQIDFDKHMLILLKMGDRPTGSSMTIDSTEITDSRLIVHWKILPPKIHRLNQKQAIAGMFLVDRFDGEVVFDPPLPVPLRDEEIREIIARHPEADPDVDAVVAPPPPVMVEEYPPGGSDIRVYGHLPTEERLWGQYERGGGIVAVRKFEDYKNLPSYRNGSIGFEERIAQSFRVRRIDLSKQMILHVHGGYRPEGLNFTQVESIKKVDGKLVVKVRIGKMKDPKPAQYFIGQVLLTERFDGEIVFERVEGEWLTGKMVKPINTEEFGGSDLKVFDVRRSSGSHMEGTPPKILVARTENDLWKVFGWDGREDRTHRAEQVFGYRKVDMKTQMILRVSAGWLPREGYRLKVTSLKNVDGTLVVRSELVEDHSNEATYHRSNNPAELLLVEKFAGPIRMAPIDDQTTLKSRFAGSSRVAILAQGVIELLPSARVGKKEYDGYEKRQIRWTCDSIQKMGSMLNMARDQAMYLTTQALGVKEIDFEKHTLLYFADGLTENQRTYTYFGGRRLGSNLFIEVEEKGFVPHRNELFIYYRIEEKPREGGKFNQHLPVGVLMIERYGAYIRMEKNPLQFVDK